MMNFLFLEMEKYQTHYANAWNRDFLWVALDKALALVHHLRHTKRSSRILFSDSVKRSKCVFPTAFELQSVIMIEKCAWGTRIIPTSAILFPSAVSQKTRKLMHPKKCSKVTTSAEVFRCGFFFGFHLVMRFRMTVICEYLNTSKPIRINVTKQFLIPFFRVESQRKPHLIFEWRIFHSST